MARTSKKDLTEGDDMLSAAPPIPPTTNGSGRVQILSLSASNFKSLKVVELDEFGEVTEIRGDSGQGKTSILDAIEAALVGFDPQMVRRGATHAELVLELTSARIMRIVRADGKKPTVMVTAADGQPVVDAKAFLQSIMPESNVFRPLEFIQLGTRSGKGQLDGQRQQREMLLNAMPARLTLESVVNALSEIAPGMAPPTWLKGIGFNGHAIDVCAQIEKLFYDERASVNGILKAAESRLSQTPAPAGMIPGESLEQLDEIAEQAEEAHRNAQSEQKANQQATRRRDTLKAEIESEGKDIPPTEQMQARLTELAAERDARGEKIHALRAQLEELEAAQSETLDRIIKGENLMLRARHVAAKRKELAEVEAMLKAAPDTVATEKAMVDAQARHRVKELHEKHLAAVRERDAAREKSDALSAAVKLFKDTLPARIMADMKLPVEGLALADGAVTFNGLPLNQLGTSEQMRITVQIAAATNRNCGFIFVDGAESLGAKDRLALAQAAHDQGLQLLMTFVDPEAVPAPGRVVMRQGEVVKP